MRKTYAAAVIAAMLTTVTPALGDVVVKDGHLATVPYREVRFGDLNLDTQQGLDRLNTRIVSAVLLVCGQSDNRQLREYGMMRDCREASMTRAFADRDTVLAARMAARGQPDKLAAIDSSIAIAAVRAR